MVPQNFSFGLALTHTLRTWPRLEHSTQCNDIFINIGLYRFTSRLQSTRNKRSLKSLFHSHLTAGRRRQAESTRLDFRCPSRPQSTYWSRLPDLIAIYDYQELCIAMTMRYGTDTAANKLLKFQVYNFYQWSRDTGTSLCNGRH